MGKNCDLPYDPCPINGDQCKNGGQCKRKVQHGVPEKGVPKDFLCDCIFGYSGYFCEINDDDCKDVQCPPNKECIDGVGTYECGCPQGKTGANCQENVDACSLRPCKNNGTCYPTTNGYR